MKINGNHKYEIKEDNVVEIWNLDATENDAPWLRQPFDPSDGLNFESVEEATTWVENYLTEYQAEPTE